MRRWRWLVVGLVGVLVLGLLGATVVMARARQQSHKDWIETRNLTLAPAVKGLKEPTLVVGPPDGSGRLFVLERAGRIKVADASGQLLGTPFLDLTDDTSTSTEQGLLGLAFHPAFTQNGYVYVDYTAADSSVQVVRYTVSPDRPNQVDPATRQTVLSIPKQSKYHNGGQLAFGPDGMLYIAVGDDESSEKAQTLDTVMGKILRIDVDAAQPYAIPDSNPFVGTPGARGEIWAYGFRNPWRFGFDRSTGDLWIGDVGDARMEEVDFLPAGASGQNYGWPWYEGTECMESEHCQASGLVPPVTTYGHDMNCAVVGGYVYRGPTAAALRATYLFGDLCTGGVFALTGGADQGWKRVELGFQPIKISSFGEDPAGDIYVVDLQGGVVYRVMDGSVPAS